MRTAQFLLLLALSGSADPGDDKAKTLETIRAAVREQFTSIKALELQFHEDTMNVHRANWELTIDESKFLIASSDSPNWGWYSFDGIMYYCIHYDLGDPGKIQLVYRSPLKYQSQHLVAGLPLELFGWKLAVSDTTFLELLDRPEVTLLGNEDVDGNPCWKVDLGMIKYKGKTTNRLTAWFDPAVGYWMRRRLSMPEIV